MRSFALIPAAGSGTRFRGELPKQYATIEGKPLLLHAVARLRAGLALAEAPRVLIAPDDAWFDVVVGDSDECVALRCGGATRAETVRNGLDTLASTADANDWVLVHDAARPCVDAAALRRLQDGLANDPVGGLLALPAMATVKRADDEGRVLRTESRERLWLAQTPQMFRYGLLREALAQDDAERFTDEAQAVEALGKRPRLIEGSSTNLKVTYADDLALAAAILAHQRASER
jgi:2-C-methyl-D-erythritol 4-phosphate cytidylyltransferase